jgi:hypothetical protein
VKKNSKVVEEVLKYNKYVYCLICGYDLTDMNT